MDEITRNLAETVAKLAQEKNAEEIVMLDVAGLCSYADALIVCHGRSNRQVQTIAEFIRTEMKHKGNLAIGMEGYQQGHWVLIDFGHVVAHIFYQPVRDFYDIEGIWPDAKSERFDA